MKTGITPGKEARSSSAFRWICSMRLSGCLMLALAAAHTVTWAQDYPRRTISIVTGYPPGGIVDVIARLASAHFSERFGQSAVVENVTGASGTLAAAKVAAARPDGYTLLLGSGSEIGIAKLIGMKVPYDADSDLAPISLAGTTPMVLLGGPRLKAGTLDELLAVARARPGQLTYASTGVGTPTHLAGELIKIGSRTDIVHVPYKGAPQAIPDLIGGHIDLAMMTLSTAIPHISSGKLRAFGITQARRSPAAPNVPALAEHKELAAVDMSIWWGLFAPAKTPAPIISRLNTEFNEVLRNPGSAAKLTEQAVAVAGSTPGEFQSFIRTDREQYRRVVNTANIRAE